MYLIVGLGNPEEEYSGTRHNMGFDTINKISQKYNIKVIKNKFNGLYEKCNLIKASNLYESKWKLHKRIYELL